MVFSHSNVCNFKPVTFNRVGKPPKKRWAIIWLTHALIKVNQKWFPIFNLPLVTAIPASLALSDVAVVADWLMRDGAWLWIVGLLKFGPHPEICVTTFLKIRFCLGLLEIIRKLDLSIYVLLIIADVYIYLPSIVLSCYKKQLIMMIIRLNQWNHELDCVVFVFCRL